MKKTHKLLDKLTKPIEAFTVESGEGGDVVWGVATLLNPNEGASSRYTATALVNFNAVNGSVTSAGTLAVAAALARESGGDKEILQMRDVSGGMNGAITEIVLTFPTGHQPGVDPVSVFFFDEGERRNFSPPQINLPWEVNVCTVATVGGVTTLSCPGTGNDLDVVGATGTFNGG